MRELLDVKNPPALIRGRRDGALSIAEIRRYAEDSFSKLPDVKRQTAYGVLLLWHDHWKEAHESTDDFEGHPDSDLLHAMVHRREGDYGNSEYWLRETGHHPLFDILGSKVTPLLAGDETLHQKIIPSGKWNARGFVAAVKANPGDPVLREIQAVEFMAYFTWLTS